MMNDVMIARLVVSQFNFAEQVFVMPAQAGIQEPQAVAAS